MTEYGLSYGVREGELRNLGMTKLLEELLGASCSLFMGLLENVFF
jgi:hypothetical protein